MNAAILALIFATASANTVITTSNECFNTQGGALVDTCNDVYFLTCDKYEIFAGSSCNVFTFSDSRIVWDTSDIKVNIWTYYLNPEADADTAITADEFADTDEANCYAINDGIPESYS